MSSFLKTNGKSVQTCSVFKRSIKPVGVTHWASQSGTLTHPSSPAVSGSSLFRWMTEKLTAAFTVLINSGWVSVIDDCCYIKSTQGDYYYFFFTRKKHEEDYRRSCFSLLNSSAHSHIRWLQKQEERKAHIIPLLFCFVEYLYCFALLFLIL